MQIVRYEERHVEAVRRLNERFAEDGSTDWRFLEHPDSTWLPDAAGASIAETFYVAEDGDEVRGGYILKRQPFLVDGTIEEVGTFYLPLSEGIIDPAHRSLGLKIIRDAFARHPLMFGLGMGGTDRSLARTLKALSWWVGDVPFHFLPLRAGRFLENLQLIQRRPWARLPARLASLTGIAAAGLAVTRAWRREPRDARLDTTVEVVETFGPWADQVWAEAKSRYALCAERSSEHQNTIYGDAKGGSTRVLVRSAGEVAGWFVTRNRAMEDNNYFGNMRVGSIVDALARPGFENHVVWAAGDFLEKSEVDIVICNMLHGDWRAALAAAGYFTARSNYGLAISPQLCQRLDPVEKNVERAHFMRGDGEGPTHL